MDLFAREIDMDPAELRRRNLIEKDDFSLHDTRGHGLRRR